jgi:hypothetical protein
MTVIPVGSEQIAAAPSLRQPAHKVHDDFDQLFQALQSGNLPAAQQAYSSLAQLIPATGTAASSAAAPAALTTSAAVASDWSALGQALNASNATSAQVTFGQLQQDASAAWQAHRQQELQNAQSVYALLQSASLGAAANSTPAVASPGGTVGNDLGALQAALQSGDTANAQKVLAQLEQDLQSAQRANGQGYGHHHHHRTGQRAQDFSSLYGGGAAPTASTSISTSAVPGSIATVAG